jgi:hypothetical protein
MKRIWKKKIRRRKTTSTSKQKVKTQANKWIKFQPLTQYWGFGVTNFLDLVNNEIDIFFLLASLSLNWRGV